MDKIIEIMLLIVVVGVMHMSIQAFKSLSTNSVQTVTKQMVGE